MRPTRWTRQRRATKKRKGGWSVRRFGFNYTHPVTGNGVHAGWNLTKAVRMRREQETRVRQEASARRHNEALGRLYWEDPERFWELAGQAPGPPPLGHWGHNPVDWQP